MLDNQIVLEPSRNMISADRTDLPPTIMAIRFPTLNVDALSYAASLLKGPVQTVQIETSDVPPELTSLPHRLISEYGLKRISLDIDVVDPATTRPTPTWKISDGVRDFFGAINIRDKPMDTLLREWRRILDAMPIAARQLWPDALMGMWVLNSGCIDQRSAVLDSRDFHVHSGYTHHYVTGGLKYPGLFLNFTPSGDGTVFKAGENNYWYGKAGTFNLHITDGHPEMKSPEHGAPDRFMSPIIGEKRATAVLQIYQPKF